MDLLRGPSALFWQRAYIVSWWCFGAALVAMFVFPIFLDVTFGAQPVGASVLVGLFGASVLLFASAPLFVSTRDDAERKLGYTMLPFGHTAYDLIDLRTGAVIRPAGVSPLAKWPLAVSLRRERARAAITPTGTRARCAAPRPGAAPDSGTALRVRSTSEWIELAEAVQRLAPDTLVIAAQRNAELEATINLIYGLPAIPKRFVWSIDEASAVLWTGVSQPRSVLTINRTDIEQVRSTRLGVAYGNGATVPAVEFLMDDDGIKRSVPFVLGKIASPPAAERRERVERAVNDIQDCWRASTESRMHQ